MAVQGHPRSVIFGSNQKRICDFLLVVNNYFGRLAPFLSTATYWLKIAYSSYPLLFSAPLPIFPLEFHGEVKRQETEVMVATLW